MYIRIYIYIYNYVPVSEHVGNQNVIVLTQSLPVNLSPRIDGKPDCSLDASSHLLALVPKKAR